MARATTEEEFIQTLKSVLESSQVLEDEAIKTAYETDWSGRFSGPSLCVLRPRTTSEVVTIVHVAEKCGIYLVPQGGNTGLVGGAVALAGEAILSLSSMDQIIWIDQLSRLACVESGCTLEDLNTAARGLGLMTGVDIASRGSATLGGMVSTNAGGIRVLRYGSMRNSLVGIEAVLSGGRVISRLDGLVKDNSGYDLAALFCGAEGTLGVITKVVLSLVPLKTANSVALIACDSLSNALDVVTQLRRSSLTLSALEVILGDGLRLMEEYLNRSFPTKELAKCALLIELEEGGGEVEKLASVLIGLPGVEDGAFAGWGSAAFDELWSWRELLPTAISRMGIPLKFDISLPFGKIVEFVDVVTNYLSLNYPEVIPVIFGHLGDGNLHVNLLGVTSEETIIERVIFSLTARLGGSISAEHGIGTAKTEYLSLVRSKDETWVLRSLKAALDPRGIFNPAVMLPPVES